MTLTYSWQFFAVVSAVFAALTAILAKVGISGINPNLATLVRTLVILLMTSLIISARAEWQRPEMQHWWAWACLILSGITTGLSWLFYFRALQSGPVSVVAPLDKLSVALTILLGWLILGEALTAKTLLGGGLVVAGTLVLLL